MLLLSACWGTPAPHSGTRGARTRGRETDVQFGEAVPVGSGAVIEAGPAGQPTGLAGGVGLAPASSMKTVALLGLVGLTLTGAQKQPTRVLFVGNSFTYGPPARMPDQALPDKGPLNNLPRIFSLVAQSLGVPVVTNEDTIGGCTAIAHTECNGQSVGAPKGCERVMLKTSYASARGYGSGARHDLDWPGGPFGPDGHSCANTNSCVQDETHFAKAGAGFPRLRDGEGDPVTTYTTGPMIPFLPSALAAHCAIPCASRTWPSHSGGGDRQCKYSIKSGAGTYHPCPQLALGPALGAGGAGPRLPAWDFIVVQSHSAEPGIPAARKHMFGPAFDRYGELAESQGATLVAYMTWGYVNGSGLNPSGDRVGSCPHGSKTGCFPHGHLDTLAKQSGVGIRCDRTDTSSQQAAVGIGDFPCQGYGIARG